MGHDLRRMIRDGAPPEWTPLMRDVAKEIADDARDPRPEDPPLPEGQWPWSSLPIEGHWDRNGNWRDGLAEICGAAPRAISDALTRLGRWGYEMRQPITDRNGKPVRDKRGRMVYAAKGHALRLWVPPLPPRPEPKRSHGDATNEAQSSHHNATFDHERSHHNATNNARSSHPDASTDPQRSHPGVSKVAPQCDPIPSVSPQPLSPHKSQSPQPPLLAAVADAEASPAGAESESFDGEAENGRCRYAGCRTPEKPVSPGARYHGPCRHLVDVRTRQDQHGGGEAA